MVNLSVDNSEKERRIRKAKKLKEEKLKEMRDSRENVVLSKVLESPKQTVRGSKQKNEKAAANKEKREDLGRRMIWPESR